MERIRGVWARNEIVNAWRMVKVMMKGGGWTGKSDVIRSMTDTRLTKLDRKLIPNTTWCTAKSATSDFFTQKMSVVNRGWQPMRSEYWLKKYAPLTGYSVILPGPQLSSLNVVENTPIKVWLQNKYVLLFINYKKRSFSVLILFVGWQEGHPACKKNLAPAIPEVSTLGVLCGIQSNLEKIGQLNRNYENWGVPNRGLEYSAEFEYWIRIVESTIQLNTNKQIHGFAYFDKHYAVLMLKSICLETGILFYAYR